jgi:hypothetical protein
MCERTIGGCLQAKRGQGAGDPGASSGTERRRRDAAALVGQPATLAADPRRRAIESPSPRHASLSGEAQTVAFPKTLT